MIQSPVVTARLVIIQLPMGWAFALLAVGVLCLVLYTLRLNWVLSHTPQEAADCAEEPLTKEYIREMFERVKRDGD